MLARELSSISTDGAVPDRSAESLRRYDLSPSLAPFLDPHMLIPLLSWLGDRGMYRDDSVKNLMVKVLAEHTCLANKYREVSGKDPPPAMEQRTTERRERFQQMEQQLRPFIMCMLNAKKTWNAQNQNAEGQQQQYSTGSMDKRSIEEWSKHWQMKKDEDTATPPSQKEVHYKPFGAEVFDVLLGHCHNYFIGGEYSLSRKWLLFYLETVCEFTYEAEESPIRMRSAMWGAVASILLSLPPPHELTNRAAMMAAMVESDVRSSPDEDEAYRAPGLILKLDELLEASHQRASNREALLVQRAHLLHWAVWAVFRYYLPLLLFANNVDGSVASRPVNFIPRASVWAELLEWMYAENNFAVTYAVAPHLLRYYAVLGIINRQRQDHFKLVITAVNGSKAKYSDPFTSLLEALFIDFDFDAAQKVLGMCSVAAEADFFLNPIQGSVEEYARLVIFETYCRIHKSINIDMIASKLNMTSQTAERWIVNLIRHAKLEAKIDSEHNRVEITTQPPNIYQQVIEKTRNLGVRSNFLVQNFDRPVTAGAGYERSDRRERRGGPRIYGGFDRRT